MTSQRRATVLDVAHHAGVSRATVSLVLQDSSRISDATKIKVRQSIRELGYRYNRSAANLRNSRSMTVGLLLADVRNSYFAEVSMAVQAELQKVGYSLLIGYTLDQVAQQKRLLMSMAEHQVDGLIMLPAPGTTAAGLHELLGKGGVPQVLIGRRVEGLATDLVTTDNRDGSRQLGEHLAALGVRTVALLGGNASTSSFTDRVLGLTEGLHGAELITVPTTATPEGGFQAAMQLLTRDGCPDAIVAYTDAVALGIYEQLRRRGIEPGRDVAVTAFDDSPVAQLLHPRLTTVATFPRVIGTETVALLLSRLADSDGPERVVTIAPHLLVAASSTSWRLAGD